jgi:MFS family permease
MWAAQTFSRFGDNIEYIALLLLIYKITNSAISIGLIALLTTTPNILLTLFGGAFADKYDKKKIMIVCDLFRGIILLAVPIAYYFNALLPIHLYIVTFLIAVFESFYTHTQNSTIPFLVTKEELMEATSIMYSSFQVVGIIGLAGGGIVIGSIGFIGVFILDSISFILSALAISSLKFESQVLVCDKNNLIRDIIDGIKVVNSNSILKFSLGMFLFLGIIIGPLDVTIPYFVEQTYRNSQAQSTYIGLMFGGLSLGIVLGSIFIKKLTKKINRLSTILLCSVFMTTINIILAYGKNYIFIMISTFLLGWFTAILRTLVITNAYENIEPQYIGRFVSLITLIALSVNPLMAFFISFILKYTQLQEVYTVIFIVGIIYLSIISILFFKIKKINYEEGL